MVNCCTLFPRVPLRVFRFND